MVALTAASWTLTVTTHSIGSKLRTILGTLLLAGTDTYPNNGIPLPVIGEFGFVRNMDGLAIHGVDPTAGTIADYVYRYDATNHKLFVYEEEATAAGGPLLEADTGEVPGARTLDFIAWGW